jgi:hypothetical protein
MNFMYNGYDIYAGVFFEAMAGFISRFWGAFCFGGFFVIRPVYAFPFLSIHYFDIVEALSTSTLITCKYLNDINVALSYLPLLLYFGRTRLATYL